MGRSTIQGKFPLHEKKTFFAILAITVIFLFISIFNDQLNSYTTDNYLAIHMIMEFFSIAVSYSIAFTSWFSHHYSSSVQRLYLSITFFAVGSLDLMHALTFPGMPFFITESSLEHTVWFWIMARITGAIGLLLIFYFITDQSEAKIKRNTAFILPLAYVTIISAVIFYSDFLPVLAVEGEGTTALKNGLEYLISFIHLVTIMVLARKYRIKQEPAMLHLLLAMVFLIFSELTFTLYISPFDFIHFFGHLYKVLGYYYLLKGIHVATIEEPFLKVQRTQKKLHDMNERLQQLTNLDGLTKIPNRRYFDEHFRKQWQNAARNHTPLSLIMVDIDFFKKFNDTYGHLAGDECLQKVAESLHQSVNRAFDLVARYGGEEFGIILPETDVEGARNVGELFRKNVESLKIPHASSDISQFVTISVGVSTIIPDQEQEPNELINMADQALYQAKHDCRNCVRFSIGNERGA